jgi:hypothetical protein
MQKMQRRVGNSPQLQPQLWGVERATSPGPGDSSLAVLAEDKPT